jgi:hypothetical protein
MRKKTDSDETCHARHDHNLGRFEKRSVPTAALRFSNPAHEAYPSFCVGWITKIRGSAATGGSSFANKTNDSEAECFLHPFGGVGLPRSGRHTDEEGSYEKDRLHAD